MKVEKKLKYDRIKYVNADSKIINCYFRIVIFLILLKDFLTTYYNNDLYETYIGEMISLSSFIFAIAVCCKNRGKFRVSKHQIQLLAGIIIFTLSISISNLISIGSITTGLNSYALIVLIFASIMKYDSSEYIIVKRIIGQYLFLYITLSLILYLTTHIGYLVDYTDGIFSSIFPFRLTGLANDPNRLGFMAAVYAILYWPDNKLKFIFGTFITILTQSKTSLIAMIAAMIVIYCLTERRNKKVIIRFILSLFLIVILANTNMIPKLVDNINNFNWTFTGRTSIWIFCIEKWEKNYLTLVFGYGKNILNEGIGGVYSLKQAHNQVINSLTANGILGLIAFLYFMYVLWRQSIKNIQWNTCNCTHLIILIMFVIRMFSEAEFSGFGINNTGVLIIALIVMINIIRGKTSDFVTINQNCKNEKYNVLIQ